MQYANSDYEINYDAYNYALNDQLQRVETVQKNSESLVGIHEIKKTVFEIRELKFEFLC